jgi:putative transposase
MFRWNPNPRFREQATAFGRFTITSAREVVRRKPSVKKTLWGGEFWTDGYYVATVGDGGNWNVVEEYVKNQGQPREEARQYKLF